MNQLKNNGGHLYVIAMSNGLTKVGRSANPKKRVNEHRVESRRYGVAITESWVSGHFPYVAHAEKALINYAAENGSPGVGNEYFTGLDFTEAVEFAKTIDAVDPIETAEDPERSLVGRNLRRLVSQSGMTVTTIAEYMGIGRESVHTKMSGKRHLAMPEILGLARALDMTPPHIMAELTRTEDAA